MSVIPKATGAAESYTLTGLAPSTNYAVTVRGTNLEGVSDPSVVQGMTTPGP